MLTVVIICDGDAAALARTLAVLVPHSVSGAVCDVTVIAGGEPPPELVMLCDQAGCALLDGGAEPLERIVMAGRGRWLLLLPDGARPVGDWLEAVEDHIHAADASVGARFGLAAVGRRPFWRRVVGRMGATGGPLGRGLLISRRQAQAQCRPGGSLADLRRGMAIRALPARLLVD